MTAEGSVNVLVEVRRRGGLTNSNILMEITTLEEALTAKSVTSMGCAQDRFVELEWRFGSLRTSYSKRLIALIPIRIAVAAIFASSDVVAGVVFQEDRAVPLLVICQPKSVFLCKLRDLCLPIFFSYRPEPLQFLLVDGAVPQIVGLEL